MLNKPIFQLFILLGVAVSLVRLQTALQERLRFNNTQFVYDLKGSKPYTNGKGGKGYKASVAEIPALSGYRVSYQLFEIEPCAINLPHVHPRASEMLYVVEGRFQSGFLEENEGRLVLNNIKEGQTTFFPQGLIHFEQNLECKKSVFLSSFNNEDPGVVTITNRLFQLPMQTLTSSFNNSEFVINKLKNSLVNDPAIGVGECRKRCGLGNFWFNFMFFNFGFY